MKTYLFDFDGTLVDSMPTYAALMLRILDENKIPYGDDIIKTITPLGFMGTAEYFIKMGLNKPRDELVAKMNEYALFEYTNNIPAKSNVIDTLKKLRSRGADLNVLTASPHATLDPCLHRLGIYDIFSNVWSCDDFATTKADPNIYRLAAERIGAPIGEILFVDDNLNADMTAKSAGMRVCGIYDESSRDYIERMKAETDFYVCDFSELLCIG